MASFFLNPTFEKALARSTLVKEVLEDLVEDGADRYREGVPVDEGDLRDSIFGQVGLTEEGYVGRVGATDWKAGLVEFGAGTNPPDGSLRRAIESLGVELGPRGGDE